MKGALFVLLVLLSLFSECFAQIGPGARQIALAHSDIANSNDVFALFNNPSGLASVSARGAGLFYSPAPFGLTELSTGFASYCEPTPIGNFAAGFSVYGFELYRETSFAIGYAGKMTNSFSVGITSLYRNIAIKNYGSRGIFIFNIGASAKLSNKFSLGFLFENMTRASIANESDQSPGALWIGGSINLQKRTSFSAAVKKEIGFNPSLKLGFEYGAFDFLIFRFGASNEPDIYCGGFGILYNSFQFDYALTSHNYLGVTHQFGVLINF